MNDPVLVLDAFDRIISETGKPDLSVSDKAGLFAGARTLGVDLEELIDELGGHGYAKEKLGKSLWHIGAALGFDITNGHDVRQHVVWAMGQANTLRSVLTEALEKRED